MVVNLLYTPKLLKLSLDDKPVGTDLKEDLEDNLEEDPKLG